MSWSSLPKVFKLGPNLIRYNNDITNAVWSKLDAGDVTATGVTAVNPPFNASGFTGICSIAGDATSGQHGVSQAIVLLLEEYEFTCYAKAGSHHHLYLKTATNKDCYFDLSTGLRGTVGSSAYAANIKPLANGWYKCTFRFAGTAASYTINISPTDADASTTMTGGDGATVNVYILNPQLCKVSQSIKDENEESILKRATDEGGQLIGGFDGYRAHTVDVTHANASATVDTKVLAVRVVDALGSVLSAAATAASAVFSRITDGTHNLGVQSDGSAIETTGIAVGGTDGTNYQHFNVDSDGAIYNVPKTVPTFEDTTNGRANTSVSYRDFVESTTAGTTVTTGTTVLAWTKCLQYSKVEIWIDNVGAAALTNVYIYASPDGTDANQQDISAYQDTVEALSQTTASGSCKVVINFDNPPAWIKIAATCGTSTTVDCYIKGRY